LQKERKQDTVVEISVNVLGFSTKIVVSEETANMMAKNCFNSYVRGALHQAREKMKKENPKRNIPFLTLWNDHQRNLKKNVEINIIGIAKWTTNKEQTPEIEELPVSTKCEQINWLMTNVFITCTLKTVINSLGVLEMLIK